MIDILIERIALPGTQDGSVLDIAKPRDGKGAITVLCGENSCGKSFVLRELRSALQTTWPESRSKRSTSTNGLRVELTAEVDSPPLVLSLTGTWKYKDSAGVIAIERKHGTLPRDIPNFERSFLRFMSRQVNSHLSDDKHVPHDFWPEAPAVRLKAVESFDLENTLYLTSREDKSVVAIEQSLGGALYFRKVGAKRSSNTQLELVLSYGDGSAIPYSRWSDGQRALCYLAVLITEIKPSILLLDELENHLHPTYMTHALRIVKEVVPQTLVTTHHPHVIFSELADRVLHLETQRTSASAVVPQTLTYRKVDFQPAPPRKIRTLDTDFDKLAATYKLFHNTDKQLLRQAALVRRELDLHFYGEVANLFVADAVPARRGSFADPQAVQLAEVLSEHLAPVERSAEVSILDFGAGLGRIPLEVAKVSRIPLPSALTWHCWEPSVRAREKLRSRVSDVTNVHVPDSLEDICGQLDVCVMANLVHEITPPQFVDAVLAAFIALHERGTLVILELYPLLHAEHFAVPYPQHALRDLLRSVGFSVNSAAFRVREAEAYVVSAKRRGAIAQQDEFIGKVEALWQSLRMSAVQNYAARERIQGMRGYIEFLHDMTTIASVTAYESKQWSA